MTRISKHQAGHARLFQNRWQIHKLNRNVSREIPLHHRTLINVSKHGGCAQCATNSGGLIFDELQVALSILTFLFAKSPPV